MPVTPYRYSDSVYAAFGRAAHAARLLEKELATFLLLPEFQKKGKISTATFAKVHQDLEKSPLGPLVKPYVHFGATTYHIAWGEVGDSGFGSGGHVDHSVRHEFVQYKDGKWDLVREK